MSTAQQPGAVPSPAAAVDAPPSYTAAEQSKNPGGPPAAQVPYATNVPFAGGYPMVQGLPQYVQPQVQYVIAAPFATATPKPGYPGPHDFLAYTVIVAVMAGFLNLLSLALTIPAIVCAAMSMHKRSQGQYPAASKLGMAAFILTTITMALVLLTWLIIVGSLVGETGDRCTCQYLRYNRIDGYSCYSGYSSACYYY